MNRITTDKLLEWLKPRLESGVRGYAGRIPDMPNRAFGVTIQPGPGLIMEGLFDVITFQVAARGAENNLDDAERIALEIDNVLINAPDNFEIGVTGDSVWCNGIGRTGSGPSQLPYVDAESRYTFTCNYYASVSTS